MKTIAKYTAFIAAALAWLYICIQGGDYTAIIALLVMVAITAIAGALIAAALVREIYREIIKPVFVAIRRFI